jgi:hypothetical protein
MGSGLRPVTALAEHRLPAPAQDKAGRIDAGLEGLLQRY